MYNPNNI